MSRMPDGTCNVGHRPKDGSKYTLDFNGRLGREIMDLELARGSSPLQRPQDSASSVEGLQVMHS